MIDLPANELVDLFIIISNNKATPSKQICAFYTKIETMKISPTPNKTKRGFLSTNKECHDAISTAATKFGEPQIVDTFRPFKKKPKRNEIDIGNISEDDLTSLKERDSFMYYSIPGVRGATWLMRDIDTANLSVSRPGGAVIRSQKAARSSRISFECSHLDLFLEEVLRDDHVSDEDENLD